MGQVMGAACLNPGWRSVWELCACRAAGRRREDGKEQREGNLVPSGQSGEAQTEV